MDGNKQGEQQNTSLLEELFLLLTNSSGGLFSIRIATIQSIIS